MSCVLFRFVSSRSQVETKPGRQMVTFLMVTNIAMWLLNTLETSRTDSHPTQVSRMDNDDDDEVLCEE